MKPVRHPGILSGLAHPGSSLLLVQLVLGPYVLLLHVLLGPYVLLLVQMVLGRDDLPLQREELVLGRGDLPLPLLQEQLVLAPDVLPLPLLQEQLVQLPPGPGHYRCRIENEWASESEILAVVPGHFLVRGQRGTANVGKERLDSTAP